MKINCPVCNKVLNDDVYGNIFQCDRQLVFIEQIGIHKEIVHASIILDKDGESTLTWIESGPYLIEIINYKNKKRTKISKFKTDKNTHYKYGGTYERVSIIDTPSVLSAPWHDKKLLEEKIKKLLLFL